MKKIQKQNRSVSQNLNKIFIYGVAWILLTGLINPDEVAAALQAVSLNPSSVGKGAVGKNIAIYGSGFQCGVKVTFSDPSVTSPNDPARSPFQNLCPSGVIPSNVQFVSTSSTTFTSSNVFIYVNVQAGSTTPSQVVLTFTNPLPPNGDGSSATKTLIINPSPVMTLPLVTNPLTVTQGMTFDLTINGSGIQNGANLSFSVPGLTVNAFTVNGPGTEAIANIIVSQNVMPSRVGVTLTNPDGGVSTVASGFSIQPFFGSKTPAITVYEDPRAGIGNRVPYNLFWNGIWSQEGNLVQNSQSYYMPQALVLKSHPFQLQQMAAHLIYPYIEFQVLDQGTWSHPLLITDFSSSISSKNFDVAFESQSGNGLIVYGTYLGVYGRRFFQSVAVTPCDPSVNGNSSPPCWGNPITLLTAINPTDSNNSTFLARAKLLSNPDSTKNEILLAYQDDKGNLYLRSWNGSANGNTGAFSPEYQVSTATRADSTPFDLAYSQIGKQGMLAWLEVNNGTPKSCLWSGTTSTCVLTVPNPAPTGSTATTNLFSIKLVSDPASNKIALATLENGSTGILKVQIWDGTTWPPPNSYPGNLMGVILLSNRLNALFPGFDQTNFDLIWKTAPANRLFAVYADFYDGVTGFGGLRYQSWVPASGWDSTDTFITAVPADASGTNYPLFGSLQFDSDPRTGDILGAMKTTDSPYNNHFSDQLFTIRWDGNTSSWTEFTNQTAGAFFSLVTPVGINYFKSFPTISATTSAFTFTQGSAVNLSVSGTFIQNGAVVTFPGFTGSTTVAHLGGVDTVTATGSISLNAIPGVYDLTITNSDRSNVIGKGMVTINASLSNSPTIYSVIPNSRGQGAANQTLVLSGYRFPASFAVSFSGNSSDINVTSQTMLSPDQVSIQVDVSPNAVVGTRGVVITDLVSGGQSYISPGLFTVNYGPTILSVTPGGLIQGSKEVPILLSGNDFKPGAAIILTDGSNTLGSQSSGTISSSLYQNKMTGNRFYISAETSPAVVLSRIEIGVSLVDSTQGKKSGQVAIYTDNGGVPGTLLASREILELTPSPLPDGSPPNFFDFNLSAPVILPAPASYWVLFNVNGVQTLIVSEQNVANCTIDGFSLIPATPCAGISKDQTYGSWPATGGLLTTWRQRPGIRYGIYLSYYPVVGSAQTGTNSSGIYQDEATGSDSLTVGVNTQIRYLYAYVKTVDPLLPSATMAIYDNSGAGGTPGNSKIGALNISNTSLIPNSFNRFQVGNFGVALSAGTYWIMANAKGAGTTFAYDSGGGVVANSVQSPLTYTSAWPAMFLPATTLIPQTRYSFFGVTNLRPLGQSSCFAPAPCNTDGPDSNQFTGTQFITTAISHMIGISFFVNTVDSGSPFGQAAIYDDNNGTPGNRVLTTSSQTLLPGSFNTISIPPTQLPAGKYWILVNVSGPLTTLTYDEGTTETSAKRYPAPFSNPWPATGGTGWTTFPGRRYAFHVVPDISVSSSSFLTNNSLGANISIDPTAGLGLREICVLNPDGGKGCFTVVDFVKFGTITNPALTVYGTTLSPFSFYRKWNGYSPWATENSTSATPASPVLWEVIRPSPKSGTPEKISGSISNVSLTLQVWNGTSWGSSPPNVTPSAAFSRSFDIAYESLSGKGLAVYGMSGNSAPQYQIWNGLTWTSGTVPGSPTGTPLWVRLEPNPKSNEIVLVYLTGNVNPDSSVTNGVIHALIWNGTSFGNEQVVILPASNINLCSTCTPPVIGQSFDIAYENRSGRAFLAWGSVGNPTPSYMIWNGVQWSAQATANQAAADSLTGLIYFKLSGDSNSNQIAMGTGTLDGQYYIQIWNGASWGSPVSRMDTASPSFSLTGEWSASSTVPPGSVVTEKVSQVVSDFGELTFSGTEINIIGQKNKGLGIADIYLDNQIKGSIDFYSLSPVRRRILFSLSNLTNSTHQLRIEPSGSKNSPSFPGAAITDSFSTSNRVTGSLFKVKNNTTIKALSVFLKTCDPVSTRRNFQIALYSDNGGVPGNLLGPMAPVTGTCFPGSTDNTWINQITVPGILLTKGNSYWIMVNTNGNGNALTYTDSSVSGTQAKSVQMNLSYGTWPSSFAAAAPWTQTPSRFYGLYGAEQFGPITIGMAPPVPIDAFEVKSQIDSPAVGSIDLLYQSDQKDNFFNVGRTFDLAWEKDSGQLLTVFGSPRSVNVCNYFSASSAATKFYYGTRFRKWNSTDGWLVDQQVPLVGSDLVPRWIQLSSDSSSNDLFLGVIGHPIDQFVPSSANATECVVAFSPLSTVQNPVSDLSILHNHQYGWHHEAWTDKEVLSTASSGSLQSTIGFQTYTSFGESLMTAFDPDATPPSPISTLTYTGVSSSSVSLQWLASGDDGDLGRAATYTVAYSTSPINTELNYAAIPLAQKITISATPFAVGTSLTFTETFTVTNLNPSTTYYFAVKATDRAGNISSLSPANPSVFIATSASGTVGTGITAPGPISDLTVVSGSLTNNNVQLTWTAPGNTGSIGTAAAYDLRWSGAPITNDSSFNTATPVLATDGTGRNGLSVPHAAGTREFFDFVGLPQGTLTYFAIKACGTQAMDIITFRCAGNPANISPINSNSPVLVNNGGVVNLTPPAAISDMVVSNTTSNALTLHWTAPGNNGQIGAAMRYDLRISANPITSVNFDTAFQVLNLLSPASAGSVQSFTVGNLLSNNTTGQIYYFAIKAVNSSGIVSAISNIVSGTTLPLTDTSPPAAISDLFVVTSGINSTSVTLSWTATGDNGTAGTAYQYDIRYSELPIVEDGAAFVQDRQIEFKNAGQVTQPPLPGPSGHHELFTLAGLNSNTIYYFAVKAVDKASNRSFLSTCVNCPGHTALRSGYNLVSVPYRLNGTNDPASVFGNDVSKPVTVYQWNNGFYSIPAMVSGGNGYFLYSPGNNSILKASDTLGNSLGTPENSPNVMIPLQTGWNMIGNPYLHPIFLKDTCIKKGTSASVPFMDAVSGGWVDASIYSFDGTQYSAERYVDILNPPANPPADLDPWNGYWFQVLLNDAAYTLVYVDSGGCP